MSIKNTFKKNNIKFNYDYIYQSIKKINDFDEDEYSYFVKDVITILFESEKNGEVFIDVDNKIIDFDLYEKGWPKYHIEVLEKAGLINSKNSPIIFNKRKLSWIKWHKKFNKVKDDLTKKISNKNLYLSSSYKLNNLKFIKESFKYSDLILLEGGPGTGKTTLVIKAILDLIKENSSLKIGLAAPTGKATARLKDSIESQLIINNSKEYFIECQTLHRWIDDSVYKLEKLKFNLFDLDLIVIDEMSMVSFDIFSSILNSISQDCKMILVGDSNQLPPINSCSIWNYIFDKTQENFLKEVTLNLKRIYRNSGDIINLSKSVINKPSDFLNKEIELINSNKSSNVRIYNYDNYAIPEKLKNEIKRHLEELKSSVQKLSNKNYIFENNIDNLLEHEELLTNDILKNLNSMLILCQRNKGPWSVKNINEVILGHDQSNDIDKLNEGIPIMCTKNNPSLGLSNGDIGVLIGKSETRKFLFRRFNKNNEPIINLVNPSKSINIVPAIAITIHKSQGSESNKVIVLWNNSQNHLSSDLETKKLVKPIYNNDFEKRLLYTAITRARNNLDLYYIKKNI